MVDKKYLHEFLEYKMIFFLEFYFSTILNNIIRTIWYLRCTILLFKNCFCINCVLF